MARPVFAELRLPRRSAGEVPVLRAPADAQRLLQADLGCPGVVWLSEGSEALWLSERWGTQVDPPTKLDVSLAVHRARRPGPGGEVAFIVSCADRRSARVVQAALQWLALRAGIAGKSLLQDHGAWLLHEQHQALQLSPADGQDVCGLLRLDLTQQRLQLRVLAGGCLLRVERVASLSAASRALSCRVKQQPERRVANALKSLQPTLSSVAALCKQLHDSCAGQAGSPSTCMWLRAGALAALLDTLGALAARGCHSYEQAHSVVGAVAGCCRLLLRHAGEQAPQLAADLVARLSRGLAGRVGQALLCAELLRQLLLAGDEALQAFQQAALGTLALQRQLEQCFCACLPPAAFDWRLSSHALAPCGGPRSPRSTPRTRLRPLAVAPASPDAPGVSRSDPGGTGGKQLLPAVPRLSLPSGALMLLPVRSSSRLSRDCQRSWSEARAQQQPEQQSLTAALQQLGHNCGESAVAADLAAVATQKQLHAVQGMSSRSRQPVPLGGMAGEPGLSDEQYWALPAVVQLQLRLLECCLDLQAAAGAQALVAPALGNLLLSQLQLPRRVLLAHWRAEQGSRACSSSDLDAAYTLQRQLALRLLAAHQLQAAPRVLHVSALEQLRQALLRHSQLPRTGDAEHAACSELLLLTRDHLSLGAHAAGLADAACSLLGAALVQQEQLLRRTRLPLWSAAAVQHMGCLVELYTQLVVQVRSRPASCLLLQLLGMRAGGTAGMSGGGSGSSGEAHSPGCSWQLSDSLQLVLDFLAGPQGSSSGGAPGEAHQQPSLAEVAAVRASCWHFLAALTRLADREASRPESGEGSGSAPWLGCCWTGTPAGHGSLGSGDRRLGAGGQGAAVEPSPYGASPRRIGEQPAGAPSSLSLPARSSRSLPEPAASSSTPHGPSELLHLLVELLLRQHGERPHVLQQLEDTDCSPAALPLHLAILAFLCTLLAVPGTHLCTVPKLGEVYVQSSFLQFARHYFRLSGPAAAAACKAHLKVLLALCHHGAGSSSTRRRFVQLQVLELLASQLGLELSTQAAGPASAPSGCTTPASLACGSPASSTHTPSSSTCRNAPSRPRGSGGLSAEGQLTERGVSGLLTSSCSRTSLAGSQALGVGSEPRLQHSAPPPSPPAKQPQARFSLSRGCRVRRGCSGAVTPVLGARMRSGSSEGKHCGTATGARAERSPPLVASGSVRHAVQCFEAVVAASGIGPPASPTQPALRPPGAQQCSGWPAGTSAAAGRQGRAAPSDQLPGSAAQGAAATFAAQGLPRQPQPPAAACSAAHDRLAWLTGEGAASTLHPCGQQQAQQQQGATRARRVPALRLQQPPASCSSGEDCGPGAAAASPVNGPLSGELLCFALFPSACQKQIKQPSRTGDASFNTRLIGAREAASARHFVLGGLSDADGPGSSGSSPLSTSGSAPRSSHVHSSDQSGDQSSPCSAASSYRPGMDLEEDLQRMLNAEASGEPGAWDLDGSDGDSDGTGSGLIAAGRNLSDADEQLAAHEAALWREAASAAGLASLPGEASSRPLLDAEAALAAASASCSPSSSGTSSLGGSDAGRLRDAAGEAAKAAPAWAAHKPGSERQQVPGTSSRASSAPGHVEEASGLPGEDASQAGTPATAHTHQRPARRAVPQLRLPVDQASLHLPTSAAVLSSGTRGAPGGAHRLLSASGRSTAPSLRSVATLLCTSRGDQLACSQEELPAPATGSRGEAALAGSTVGGHLCSTAAATIAAAGALDAAGSCYRHRRTQLGLYSDPELHVLCLELVLHLLVTPAGTLDPLRLPQDATDAALAQLVHLLAEHLSHPCNVAALRRLLDRAAQQQLGSDASEPASAAGCAASGLARASLRLLKLLSSRLLDALAGQLQLSGVLIQKGAFSEVMAGTLQRPGGEQQQVAVKLVDCRSDDSAQFERVFNEVAVLEALQAQPGVVRLLEYGLTTPGGATSYGGRRMWLLAFPRYASSLKAWRAARGPGLRAGDVAAYLDLFVQAALVVGRLHAAGVVHCDIKGDNFLLAPRQGGGSCGASGLDIVLADFGDALLADACEDGGSVQQRHRGTELFSSPEMLLLRAGRQHPGHAQHDRRRHRGVGRPHDVWGLGCSLFELLTGQLLFEQEGVGRITALVSRPAGACGVLTSSEQAALSVQPGLAELVELCLQPEPHHRPPAEAVAARAAHLLRELTADQ